MKALKLIAKIILWVVVIVVVALLALPLWIGPVAKGVANSVVPGITGTGFNLGEFGLNPYSGALHVGDMQLANPTNFSEKNAVELTRFDADFAMTSLFCGNKYRVETVELDGLVVYSDPTASNFRQIADNATGGEKKADSAGKQAETKSKAASEPGKTEPAEQGKGFQIDRLVIDNVTLKYGLVSVKVPTKIEIEGIGADSEDGASLQEIVEAAYSKILSAAGAIGGKLGDLGKGALDIGKGAAGAALDAVNAGDVEGAKAALKDAGQSIKDAVKIVKPDKAGDALKKAGNNLKDLFK